MSQSASMGKKEHFAYITNGKIKRKRKALLLKREDWEKKGVN